MIHDIRRPDVNGVPPKMEAIKSMAKTSLPKNLTIFTDDNLCSNVTIKGVFGEVQPIWMNSLYFIFHISPAHNKRYYEVNDKTTVELISKSYKILHKFRKYSGDPANCIQKIKDWLNKNETI